jgi:hypothetical protein
MYFEGQRERGISRGGDLMTEKSARIRVQGMTHETARNSGSSTDENG